MADPPPSDALLLAPSSLAAAHFGQLFDRHAADLQRWFVSCGARPQDAADLVAELFAQAWLCRHRYRDPGDGNARPWLFGIAKNLHRTYRRKQRVETASRRQLGMPTTIADPAEGAATRLDARARRSLLEDAMGTLPPLQREAVRLHVIEELPYRAIASALSCKEATARKRVSKGLQALRIQMEDTQ